MTNLFDIVMAGLDPAISFTPAADARVEPAHDEKMRLSPE
jgi:hypothetical protein